MPIRTVDIQAVEDDNFTYTVNGEPLPKEEPVRYLSGEILRFQTSNGPLKVKLTKIADGPESESSFKSGVTTMDSGPDHDALGIWAAQEEVFSDLSFAEKMLFKEANGGFISKYSYEFTVGPPGSALRDAVEGVWNC